MYAARRGRRPAEEEEIPETEEDTEEEETEVKAVSKKDVREARKRKREEDDAILDKLEEFEDRLHSPGYKLPTRTELIVLKCISVQAKPVSAVRIQNFIRALREDDDEETLVQLAPQIKILTDRGHIHVEQKKTSATAGKPKNYYSLTVKGRKALVAIESMIALTQLDNNE